jgi:hypothetical protein
VCGGLVDHHELRSVAPPGVQEDTVSSRSADAVQRSASIRAERSEARFSGRERSERPGSFSPSFYEEWFAAGEPDEVKSGSGLVGI